MHRRIATILALVAVTLGLAEPAANADQPATLTATLGQLWTSVLETKTQLNPFGKGGAHASACWDVGGVVAPLAPTPVDSCKVKSGTKIFVSASSAECSTFQGDCGGPGSTEQDLVNNATLLIDKNPQVTLDGNPVTVTYVQTKPMNIVLPKNNIFGLPEGTSGQSVALGEVALLDSLTPGIHEIHVVTKNSTPPADYVTKIIVHP